MVSQIFVHLPRLRPASSLVIFVHPMGVAPRTSHLRAHRHYSVHREHRIDDDDQPEEEMTSQRAEMSRRMKMTSMMIQAHEDESNDDDDEHDDSAHEDDDDEPESRDDHAPVQASPAPAQHGQG